MKCYLVRHGKDDDTVRGGWSDSSLTAEGIRQVRQLSFQLADDPSIQIGRIYTSDLRRARETADILSNCLQVPVAELPAFREANNGILAGMKNELAAKEYPGLYWSALGWDEHYPGGESPHEFFSRISEAWADLKRLLRKLNFDVILVTHGGVLGVIQCIENGVAYSNKTNPYPVGNAELVSIDI